MTNRSLHIPVTEYMAPNPEQARVVGMAPNLAAAYGKPQLTGGKVNYYLVRVEHPRREDQPAYQAECEDIIAALDMTFDEGCLFKALWRTTAARQGNGKPGQSAVYDGEKMVHYASNILRTTRLAIVDAALSR